jgi:hypothetical protein
MAGVGGWRRPPTVSLKQRLLTMQAAHTVSSKLSARRSARSSPLALLNSLRVAGGATEREYHSRRHSNGRAGPWQLRGR